MVAIADCDVAQYYDTLCPIRLVQWLARHGYDPVYIGAVIRLLTLPSTSLRTDGCVVPLKPRTLGVFTGSRLANALGGIPFLDTISENYAAIIPNAFATPVGGLLVSCWVDNLTSVGPSAHKAIATLETIEKHLNIHWGLRLKAGSTRYLSAHPQDAVDCQRWKRVRKLDLLGDILTDNCCSLSKSHQGCAGLHSSTNCPTKAIDPCKALTKQFRSISSSCQSFVRGGSDGPLVRAWRQR